VINKLWQRMVKVTGSYSFIITLLVTYLLLIYNSNYKHVSPLI